MGNNGSSEPVNIGRGFSDWIEWKKSFDTIAGPEFVSKPNKEKVNAFLDNFRPCSPVPKLEGVDRNSIEYDELIRIVNNHFLERRKVVTQRHKFNTFCRRPGQSIDDFVEALGKLSYTCDFREDEREDRIRDVLRLNLKKYMQLRILQDGDITLDQTVKLAKDLEKRELQRLEEKKKTEEKKKVEDKKKMEERKKEEERKSSEFQPSGVNARSAPGDSDRPLFQRGLGSQRRGSTRGILKNRYTWQRPVSDPGNRQFPDSGAQDAQGLAPGAGWVPNVQSQQQGLNSQPHQGPSFQARQNPLPNDPNVQSQQSPPPSYQSLNSQSQTQPQTSSASSAQNSPGAQPQQQPTTTNNYNLNFKLPFPSFWGS